MKNVVIADDEPITRMNIAAMLGKLGFNVVGQAADGFDAASLCRKLRPDIALLDVRMPVFDGLTAAETITSENTAGCVVLLTAFSDKEIVEKAKKAGVSGYLVKPVNESLILPTLEIAMEQARLLRESREREEEAVQKNEDLKTIQHAQNILSEQEGISPSDAYKKLRSLSMEKRIAMAKLAEVIVSQSRR